MNVDKTKVALVVVLTGGIAAAVYAAKEDTNDAQAVVQARTTLGQAVSAAEQQQGGRATRAEFEQQKDGRWVYDVEVVSGNKTYDVKVDPDRGSVIAATEDRADNDGDHDEKD